MDKKEIAEIKRLVFIRGHHTIPTPRGVGKVSEEWLEENPIE